MLRPQAVSFLSRRHILLAVVSVSTLWYLAFHDTTTLGAASNKIGGAVWQWKGAQGVGNEESLIQQFVAKALENDIYVSKYNGTAVRELCSEAKWRDDVVASCDMLAGGIGNLKVNLLACLRYTIESGGMNCSCSLQGEKTGLEFGRSKANNTPTSETHTACHTLARDIRLDE